MKTQEHSKQIRESWGKSADFTKQYSIYYLKMETLEELHISTDQVGDFQQDNYESLAGQEKKTLIKESNRKSCL